LGAWGRLGDLAHNEEGAGIVLVATGTLLSRNEGSLDELPQPVSQA
jgi:hypothetical protein